MSFEACLRNISWAFASLWFLTLTCHASSDNVLATLKNFQVNTPNLMSSGLPDKAHFLALKQMGVSHVIDLIPDDRSQEIALVAALGLSYTNIPVDWENPKVSDFEFYVATMQSTPRDAKVLTHCKLNWRGATFMYLYRVVVLQQDEALARKDMLSVWAPNETWQRFIEDVKVHYTQ